MKLDNREIRQALDNRLSALDERPSRRAQILQSAQETGGRRAKRAASVALALAALLAFAGVGLALTANLFALFGQRDARYGCVEEQAVLATAMPVTVEDEALGALNARIDSAYYDGMTLNAVLAMESAEHVEDYAPGEQERARMEEAAGSGIVALMAGETQKRAAQQRLLDARADGTPYGYRVIRYVFSDHVRTDDGVDIPPYTATPVTLESGKTAEMREFVAPLPETLRNLDVITLNCEVRKETMALYFDGETLLQSFANEAIGSVRAAVRRNEGMVRALSGRYTREGSVFGLTAEVTPMSAVVTFDGEASVTLLDLLNGVQIPACAAPNDVWIELAVRDEQGRNYRVQSGFAPEQTLPVTSAFDGVGELPQTLEITVRLMAEGESGVLAESEPFVLSAVR